MPPRIQPAAILPRNVAARRAASWLLVALAVAFSPLALARKSDRNQALVAEAGKQQGSLDDATPTVLSGGVTIDQGTLHTESGRAEIYTRGGEISRVVLIGSPARLKQLLDDGSPMNAVANRIDYNVSNETVVFSGDVVIKQPRGTLSGERVAYNMATGQVTSGGEGNGRVKMRIMPSNDAGGDDDKPQAPPADDGDPGAADAAASTEDNAADATTPTEDDAAEGG